MLSWIKNVLDRLKPERNHSSKGSSFHQKNEEEDRGLNVLFGQEESRRKNNASPVLWLPLSTTYSSPPTPPSPPFRYSPKTTPAAQQAPCSNCWSSEAPAMDLPDVFPETQFPSQWRLPSAPSNTQITSSIGTSPTSQTLDMWGELGASQCRHPSFSEAEIPRGNQQSTLVDDEGPKVGMTDRQMACGDVLAPQTHQNLYPCCFLAATLTNHTGELITVKGKRYVRVRVKEKLLVVSLEIGPEGESPCRVVWVSGRPVPLIELPDLTCVKIDAFMSPRSKKLHGVVVWQNTKPDRCVQLLDNTYIFLDSRSLVCHRESLDIVAKKLSIVFDGTQVSAEICDAVVFMGTTRVTMVELLQLGFDQFYATVFKMLEGTGSGRVLYVCTCLWVGKRPTIKMLPMVIEKQKLYYKVSHGLYSTYKKTRTLYCDVDASLSLSGGVGTIELELDGSSRFLVATHLLSLQHGNLKEHAAARVSVHVSKEVCGRKEEWSAILINLPGSAGAETTSTWLAVGHLAPDTDEDAVTARQNVSVTQETSVSSTQKASVSSGQRANIPPSQRTTIPAVQKAVVSAAQKNAVPAKHGGTVLASQRISASVSHKACAPSKQETSVPAAQNADVAVGKKAYVLAAQEASVPAEHKASISAAQEASVPARQKASVPAGEKASVPAGQKASVPSGQKGSVQAGLAVSALAGQKGSFPAGQEGSVPAEQKTSVSAGQKGSVPAEQKTSVPAGQKGSVPAEQKTSVPAGQKDSVPARQKASVSAAQICSVPAGQAASAPVAQKTTAPPRKTQQKSASLSQLLCPTRTELVDASGSGPQSEYLTCRVLASGTSSAVVTAAGKKILVVKSNLFVNEVKLSTSANVATSLKKFPNLGVIFTHSGQQHHVLGHTVELIALVAWGGKKPHIANTIVSQQLSRMKALAASRVTPVPPTIPLAVAATVEAGCCIKTVQETSVTLTIRSKHLTGGCGTAQANVGDMYENGTPMTVTQMKKLKGKVWHCLLCIEDGGQQLTVPLAWRGKKPVTDTSSGSSGSQPRQALSTGDLSDALPLTPLASKSFDKNSKQLTPSPFLSKVLMGEVTKVQQEGGCLRAEDGRHYFFPIEVCYLFDVCLHQVEPRQVLVVGMKVEFEVVDSSSCETVQRVWVGGRDAALAFSSLKPSLDSWCSVNGVSSATQQTLMKEAELLSPSLFPTSSRVEATKIIDITA